MSLRSQARLMRDFYADLEMSESATEPSESDKYWLYGSKSDAYREWQHACQDILWCEHLTFVPGGWYPRENFGGPQTRMMFKSIRHLRQVLRTREGRKHRGTIGHCIKICRSKLNWWWQRLATADVGATSARLFGQDLQRSRYIAQDLHRSLSYYSLSTRLHLHRSGIATKARLRGLMNNVSDRALVRENLTPAPPQE